MRYCLPGRIRTSEEEGLRLYDVHASSYTVIKHCCLLYKPVFQSNSSYHCGSAAVSFVTTMYYVFNLSLRPIAQARILRANATTIFISRCPASPNVTSWPDTNCPFLATISPVGASPTTPFTAFLPAVVRLVVKAPKSWCLSSTHFAVECLHSPIVGG